MKPPDRRGAATAERAADCAAGVGPLVRTLADRGLSLQQIAAELNRLNVPAARGGGWSSASVRGVLLRLHAGEGALDAGHKEPAGRFGFYAGRKGKPVLCCKAVIGPPVSRPDTR
jgi:hypothetical protein